MRLEHHLAAELTDAGHVANVAHHVGVEHSPARPEGLAPQADQAQHGFLDQGPIHFADDLLHNRERVLQLPPRHAAGSCDGPSDVLVLDDAKVHEVFDSDARVQMRSVVRGDRQALGVEPGAMTALAWALATGVVREIHSNVYPEAVALAEFLHIVWLQLVGEGEAWRVVGVQAVSTTSVDVERLHRRSAADSPVDLLRLRRVVEELGQLWGEAGLQPRLPLQVLALGDLRVARRTK